MVIRSLFRKRMGQLHSENRKPDRKLPAGLYSGAWFLVLLLAVTTLTACANPFTQIGESQPRNNNISSGEGERVDTGFVVPGPDSYDSADSPILVEKDEKENTITFLNLDIGRRYTLSLDGTTKLYDKHGESISLSQLAVGSIVDIRFLKTKKHLTTLQLSKEAWVYENVQSYEINTVRSEVTIGKEVYKLSENTQYLSEGRAVDEMDLNPADILSFQGIGTTVLSINVEKGHGYLRLVNDENFVGGWIEIGQHNIQKITEDMLLVVAEGSYQVNISHKGGGGIKDVVINRNEETTLDIGDLAVAEVQKGMVLFSISPSNAKLYIDGSEVDASQPVTLEYGIHQIIAKAENYKSLTQYLRVGQPSAGIDVVLDKIEEEEEISSASSSESKPSDVTDATDNYYKVYIDAPEGAEVYLDGNYVGISPCSFKKNPGSHIITLRRNNHETRSYTVQIDEEEKDISYSFADLVETGTVSGSN